MFKVKFSAHTIATITVAIALTIALAVAPVMACANEESEIVEKPNEIVVKDINSEVEVITDDINSDVEIVETLVEESTKITEENYTSGGVSSFISNSKNSFDSYIGRFVISSSGVNVACYNSASQATVDASDSAAYFRTNGHVAIGDHVNQGFSAIKSCSVGTKATLTTSNGVENYTCVGVIKGHNTGEDLTDANYKSIEDLYPGALVCYTCDGNWQNVTLVFFYPDNGKETTYHGSWTSDNQTDWISQDETFHYHDNQKTELAPTCTVNGYMKYECACGNVGYYSEIEALGHNYISEVIAPTTESGGYTLHTCSRCDDSYKDNYTDALPSVVEDVVVAPPTPEVVVTPEPELIIPPVVNEETPDEPVVTPTVTTIPSPVVIEPEITVVVDPTTNETESTSVNECSDEAVVP